MRSTISFAVVDWAARPQSRANCDSPSTTSESRGIFACGCSWMISYDPGAPIHKTSSLCTDISGHGSRNAHSPFSFRSSRVFLAAVGLGIFAFANSPVCRGADGARRCRTRHIFQSTRSSTLTWAIPLSGLGWGACSQRNGGRPPVTQRGSTPASKYAGFTFSVHLYGSGDG